jgi:glycosyltransferase involved in cell wall biosynthesis
VVVNRNGSRLHSHRGEPLQRQARCGAAARPTILSVRIRDGAVPLVTPLVTAVIPTYNWSSVLRCSIASALDQTLADFELLVVGDACTDDSADVVASFAAADARVRWINLAHHGGSQVGPNNEALRQARGRFIAYLGHDDLWLPHHLEVLVAALTATAGAAATVHGRLALVNPGHRPFALPVEAWQYRRGEWIAPTSALHDAAAMRQAGGWRGHAVTGTLDPESDLCARLSDEFGAPRLVPRLTSIKLPASYRKDVYRHRPNGEQMEWLCRMRAAADPEAELALRCSEPDHPGAHDDDPVALLQPVMEPSVSAATRHAVLRRYKGLDPV